MTTFNLHCQDPWFSYIQKGIKPVEGRKKSESHKHIQVNDHIIFTNGTDSFKAVVTEIREYQSLLDYFNDVTLEKALPGISTIEEGLNIYYQWNTPETIKQYGFLGIFVKPL